MSESLPPPESWSFKLPPELKLAIADAITLFARIDNCIIETLWVIEDADLARKRKIAKGFAHENLAAIQGYVEQIPRARTDKIWPGLAQMRAERNLIAHGVWMVDQNGRPLVVWHSKFLESDDFVGAEYFDYKRFGYFTKRAEHLLNTFATFKRMLEEAAEKLKAETGTL
jgi:hypothetical protein